MKPMKGGVQLAVNVIAGLAHDIVTGTDDDQLSRDERGLLLHTAERGTDDALGAVTRDGATQLFGNGQTDAVGPLLLGVSQHSFFCGVIGEHVYGDKLADKSVASAKYLIIKMVFFDC